jgi:hypothetical protein
MGCAAELVKPARTPARTSKTRLKPGKRCRAVGPLIDFFPVAWTHEDGIQQSFALTTRN